MTNIIHTLLPYRYGSVWVFDDENFGLQREVFVQNFSAIIDTILQEAEIDLAAAAKGFSATFSSVEFPNARFVLTREKEEYGGNVYRYKDQIGWLCPALFLYFEEAPEKIYVDVSI